MTRCPDCGMEIGAGPHRCQAAATVPALGATVPLEADPARGLRPGDVLAGRYLLREKAGEGGGGIVFRAWDEELEVELALKLLPPGETSAGLRERLKREIRITREIDHPRVSRVFDLHEAGGLSFCTMRWIEGEPLSARVHRDGPLPPADLARLAEGLVSALAAAHRNRVVHRDVKPGNVMVARSGDPVLVDFGVAKELGADAARVRRLTPDGQIPGTRAYMSPEQARGEGAGPASDLHSLAQTVAYAGKGVPATEDAAHALSRVGGPLSALLVQCLADDPAARPRDATVVEDALRAARRRRATLRAAVVALPVLAIAVVGSLWAGRETAPGAGARAPTVRVDALENRTGNADLDWLEHGVRDLVAAGLERAGVRLAMGTDVPAARVAGVVERAGSGAKVSLRLEADGRVRARAAVANPAGEGLFDGVDEAVRRFGSALGARSGPRAEREAHWTDDVEAFTHFARAEDLTRRYRYLDAIEELRQATDRDPRFALAHLERHVLMSIARQGSRAEAQAALSAAAASRDRLPAGRRELLDAVLATEGDAPAARFDALRSYLRTHPPESALYRLAFRAAPNARVGGRAILEEWARRMPEDPDAHNQLGYVLLFDYHDAAGAERELREYLRLAPDVANAHDSYGELLRETGRIPEAVREYDRAVALDPAFVSSALHAADSLVRADDLVGAEERLAQIRVRPEAREFVLWVNGRAALPLLRGDAESSLGVLDGIASDPTTGSRAYLAHAYSAIVRALRGDRAGAIAHASEADRLYRLYHGSASTLPTLGPYVEGLAADRRGDVAALRRAAAAIAAAVDAGTEEEGAAPRRAVLEGLVRLRDGDPSAAAEIFSVPLGRRVDAIEGAPFLAALSRARALLGAERVADAAAAYDAAMDRRRIMAQTAEAAVTWRACLDEAESLARRLGDTAKADALASRLRALR